MADDYYYRCPTGIYITEGGIEKAGSIIRHEGYRSVFVLYGGHSLKASGNFDKLALSLKTGGIPFRAKGGIEPNPDIGFVRETLPQIREYQPDLVLAVGGGSVIDTAKSICDAYYYSGDPLDFNRKIAKPDRSLPLAVILTLAAAGSEMSDSCVISDRTSDFKGGFNDIHNRPAFSILDPSLTLSVSLFQTSCGLVDIISHSFERYFSPSSPYEVSDYLALGVIRNIVGLTPALLKDPHDLAARRGMMLSSTVSHNGWTSFGKKMRFICHFVEHQMSGRKPDLAHGLGLRFLLNEFLRINKEELKDKIAAFGQFVFGLSGTDPDQTIAAFENYLNSLPLPRDMTEAGFSEQEKEAYLAQLRL